MSGGALERHAEASSAKSTPTPVWLAAGLRTPFDRVDGRLASRDALALSVPVAKAMAAQARGPIDLGIWGSVVLDLAYNNLAREVWLEAGLDPHTPTFTTIQQCSTSMIGAFQAATLLRPFGPSLALVGGVESMSQVQIGLTHGLSTWIRRMARTRGWQGRLRTIGEIRLADLRIYVPEVKNRVTGRSMGEHCEDMAKTWSVGREEQDRIALQSHQCAVAAQDAGFFLDLVIPLDGLPQDTFPRRDTSLERLASLPPAFDRSSGKGTL